MPLNLIDILVIISILFLVWKLIYNNYVTLNDSFSKVYLLLLVGMHFFLCLFSWYWSLDQQIDAYYFYHDSKNAESWFELFGTGSAFVKFILYPLVKLGFSYFTLFFLFSYVSFLGFYNYYKILFKNKTNSIVRKLCLLFFLLPTLHFWTGFISKDAFLFYLMSVLLIKIRNQEYLNYKFFLAALLIWILRPHIFIVLLLSFLITLILEKRIKTIALIGVMLLLICSYFVLVNFANIPDFTIKSIVARLHDFNNYGKANGHSHIDLFSTNYFERIFALLFRPLYIDSIGIYQLFVSIENSLVLLFTGIIIYNFRKFKRLLKSNMDVKFAFISAILITLLISVYMYNLGLASRMRVMLIPYFLYSIFFCLEENKKKLI